MRMTSIRLSLPLFAAGCLSFLLWTEAGWAETPTPSSIPAIPLPRIDDVVVDGRGNDWEDRGLLVSRLADGSGDWLTKDGLSAGFLAGWDERGVLLFLTVRGGTGAESENEGALYQKSSVELFFSRNKYNGTTVEKEATPDVFQPMLSSGRDPRYRKLRYYIYDGRSDELKQKCPARIEATSVPSAQGYTMEVLLPWENLGLKPKPDMEFGLQVQVNDLDEKGKRTQLLWNYKAGKGQCVRLAAGQRSEEQPFAVASDTVHFSERRIRVQGPASAEGQDVSVAAPSGADYPKTRLQPAQGGSACELVFPLPPWGKETEPVTVHIDGQPVAWLEFADINKEREKVLRGAEISFDDDNVFCSDTFPSPTFDPPISDALIEPGSLSVRFFDAQRHEVRSAQRPGRYGALIEFRGKNGKPYQHTVTLFRSPRPLDGLFVPNGDVLALARAAGIPEKVALADRSMLEVVRDNPMPNWTRRIPARAEVLASMFQRPNGAPRVRAMIEERDWWYALKRQLRTAETIQYLDLLPPDYDEGSCKKWPVVVFLHGSGGHSDKAARTEPIRTYWEQKGGPPFILLQPLAPNGTVWVPSQVMEWLEQVLPWYRSDRGRIYLTGFSMGGIGTWNVACRAPRFFAAFAPAAGVGELASPSAVKGRPIWVFHGEQDAMPIAPAQAWVEELKQLDPHADVKFTRLPKVDHTNTPQEVYKRADLYEWLLSHRNP
jgi:predicted esterase